MCMSSAYHHGKQILKIVLLQATYQLKINKLCTHSRFFSYQVFIFYYLGFCVGFLRMLRCHRVLHTTGTARSYRAAGLGRWAATQRYPAQPCSIHLISYYLIYFIQLNRWNIIYYDMERPVCELLFFTCDL